MPASCMQAAIFVRQLMGRGAGGGRQLLCVADFCPAVGNLGRQYSFLAPSPVAS